MNAILIVALFPLVGLLLDWALFQRWRSFLMPFYSNVFPEPKYKNSGALRIALVAVSSTVLGFSMFVLGDLRNFAGALAGAVFVLCELWTPVKLYRDHQTKNY